MKIRFNSYHRIQLAAVGILAAIAALCVLLTGCDMRSQAEIDRDNQKQATQTAALQQGAKAAANLGPIGQHLQATNMPAEGDAVLAQAALVVDVVSSLARSLGIVIADVQPTVTFADWQAAKNDAAAARALATKLGAEKDALMGDLKAKSDKLKELEDKAKNDGWWNALASGGFWTAVAGAGLWAARIAGVPGVNLLADPLLRMIGKPVLAPVEQKAAEFGQQASVASTALMASDIARAGLSRLEQYLAQDPEMGRKIANVIGKATGGQATTLEGAFKVIAKGVAVDEGKHAEVDALLSKIRADMPTTLGTPDALNALKVG